jgi:hypothetical protein
VRLKSINSVRYAYLSAFLYAGGGLATALQNALKGQESIGVPVGFLTPVFHMTFTLRWHQPVSVPAAVGSTIAQPLLWAATGWLTGFVLCTIYNVFISKFFQLEGAPA